MVYSVPTAQFRPQIVPKPMTPDDLRRLHDYLVDIEAISIISDEMRIVVENEWPGLLHKLPPRR